MSAKKVEWTHEKPTKAGYYWMRGGCWEAHVVKVVESADGDGLDVLEHGKLGWYDGVPVDDVTRIIEWKVCAAPE